MPYARNNVWRFSALLQTFSEDGISLVANVETADKAFRKKSPLQVAGNISREPNVDNKHRR